MKKITALAYILLMGCTSVTNLKEVDLSITGLEMEFYETRKAPVVLDYNTDIEKMYQERKNRDKVTNYGKLMPMTKK